MSQIIELIKVLRDRTGAGLMDCKKALLENDNDVEKAIDWLREKGIAKVAKKSSRIAAEGKTNVLASGNDAIVLEINSETDFVANSDPFADLVKYCTSAIITNKPASVEDAKKVGFDGGKSIEETFTDATIKLGEKLDLRRFELVTKTDDEVFGTYIHMKGKISVLVVLKNGTSELAKGIGMTIAANNPSYIQMEDIPAAVVEKETAVQTELSVQDENFSKKPENVRTNIIKGRVDKILAEQVLVLQDYVLDPSKKVGQILKETGASVVKFVRYQVGEGLEKRQDDFAAEVMNQAK